MRRGASVCLMLACLLGCDVEGPPHPDSSAEAARLAPQPGTVADLEAFWAMHPGWSREQAAQAWRAQAALARQALKHPDALDPGALDDARRRGLVRAVLDAQLATMPTPTIDPQAVARHADALRRQDLGRPAGLQVSHLVVAVPHDLPDAQREPMFAQARRVLDALMPRISERPTALELGDLADAAASMAPAPLQVSSNAHLQFMRADQPARSAEALPAGWLPVVPEFAQAVEPWATPARLGLRSEPVRTPFGWHVIVVERIFEASSSDEVTLTQRATRQAEAERRQQQLTTWIGELLKPVAMAIYQKTLEDPQ